MASRYTLISFCIIATTSIDTASALFIDKIQTFAVDFSQMWWQACVDLIETLKMTFINIITASPWLIVIIPTTIISLYYLYMLIFAPLNRVRKLEEIGYKPIGSQSKKDYANACRQMRKAGEVPPVYPNGWFAVLETRALEKGQSTSVHCLGLSLAIFRDLRGKSHVVDAHCPHFGANLGVGGRVGEDCIECPFHGWKFRGEDGECVEIPYSDAKIPSFAKIKSYQSLEYNGFIHMWYHAEGAEPDWTPPELENITNGNWAFRGRTEHYVNCHIQEIPENGADLAHLGLVHEAVLLAGTDITTMRNKIYEFGKHFWKAEWKQDEEKHMGSLWLKHSLKLFGFHLKAVDMKVRAQQIGPSLVYLQFQTPFGEGVYIHTVTPQEPLLQRLLHQMYFTWYVPAIIPKFYLMGEAYMIERDIWIWNHKRYIRNPLMVKSKEDEQLKRHRRWYSQFYSENSPKLSMAKTDGADW